MKNSPTRIHWSTIESSLVRQKVLEMVSNRKMPRSSWADIFEVAQRELPINRRRDNISLTPNVWLSKDGVYRSNTTQSIAASVLRELGHDIRENVRVTHYAHYLAPQSGKNFKAEKPPEMAVETKTEVAVADDVQLNLVLDNNSPTERIASKLSDARQKMISQILEHEKDVVLFVAKEQLNPMEQRLKDMNARIDVLQTLLQLNPMEPIDQRLKDLSKTVEYLGQQMGLITEFITSHGYNPKK
jgi:hypothetical protein